MSPTATINCVATAAQNVSLPSTSAIITVLKLSKMPQDVALVAAFAPHACCVHSVWALGPNLEMNAFRALASAMRYCAAELGMMQNHSPLSTSTPASADVQTTPCMTGGCCATFCVALKLFIAGIAKAPSNTETAKTAKTVFMKKTSFLRNENQTSRLPAVLHETGPPQVPVNCSSPPKLPGREK